MATTTEPTIVKHFPASEHPLMSLDITAMDAARHSHVSYDGSVELKDMIQANLIAERIAIEAYSRMVALVGDKDPSTRRLLEDILGDKRQYAVELRDWLAD